MTLHRSALTLLAAAVSSACASKPAARGSSEFVAPSNQNVVLERQEALGLSKAQISYVKNTSSQTIIVNQISILACVNLKQYCGVNARNIRIKPGERQEIMRIEPMDETKAFNYRMQWRWRREATPPAGATPPRG